MSKITNYDLTPSGTGCFTADPYGNSGRKRIKRRIMFYCGIITDLIRIQLPSTERRGCLLSSRESTP